MTDMTKDGEEKSKQKRGGWETGLPKKSSSGALEGQCDPAKGLCSGGTCSSADALSGKDSLSQCWLAMVNTKSAGEQMGSRCNLGQGPLEDARIFQ